VKFDDGTSLPVAPDALVHQADGSYRLTKSAGSIGAVDQSNAVVIPVVADVEKEQIVRGKVRMHRRPADKSRVLSTLDLKEMLPVLPPTSNPRVAGSTPARRTIKSITYKSRFPILARIARLGVMSLVSAHVGRCLMVSISI
jgi:hypothetical protein